MGKPFFIFLFAYLAGSINFAIIFFKMTGKEDPRLIFSGNAGTTNVYRQAGIIWAAVIFLLDIGRALAVAVIACYFLKTPLLPWAVFVLALGQVDFAHWRLIAISGALATFLLILFNHRKNITNYRKTDEPLISSE